MKHWILILFAFTFFTMTAQAQKPNTNRLSLMAGLTQPLLLDGINIAATYTTEHLYFEYSHGAFLKYHSFGKAPMRAADQENFRTMVAPFSTGGGAGYRFSDHGQIFWEFKLHQYDLEEITTSEMLSYQVFEMGPALSYRLFVGAQKKVFFEPVVRYWFGVATLGNEDFVGDTVTLTRLDETTFQHQAHENGLFFNVSLGVVLK